MGGVDTVVLILKLAVTVWIVLVHFNCLAALLDFLCFFGVIRYLIFLLFGGLVAENVSRAFGPRRVFGEIFGGDDAAVGAPRDDIGEGPAAVDPDVPAIVSRGCHCPAIE